MWRVILYLGEGATRMNNDESLDRGFAAAEGEPGRRAVSGLPRQLRKLPADLARAALETSAAIAGVSLKASLEFLRAAPDAARILNDAGQLHAWGEIGRRFAMGDVETAVSFFSRGAEPLSRVPAVARPLVFEICTRQLSLSSSAALESFARMPALAIEVADAGTLGSILEVAAEISRRSATHCASFLDATPAVVARWRAMPEADRARVAERSVSLASQFSARAGGIAADAWAALPGTLADLRPEDALRLIQTTTGFLDRGGSVALQVMIAAGELLRALGGAFDDWTGVLDALASHGNSPLIAFVRASTGVFDLLRQHAGDIQQSTRIARRVLAVVRVVAGGDGEAALACFRSAPVALRTVQIEQFEDWARGGHTLARQDARGRRGYYALETRGSHDALHAGGKGVPLEQVQGWLRLYIEGLTGRVVEIAPIAAAPEQPRMNDGHTIHLPSVVAEFDDPDQDLRLYKVLAAHGAGQIEFGTHERDTAGLRAAYARIAELFAPENADARDAFSLDGYINEMSKGENAISPESEARSERLSRPQLSPGSDYRAALMLFPHAGLGRRIFATLENGRIDSRLRRAYRGLARDLDITRERLRAKRPRIIDLPASLVPFELLFQITLCGGALDDARHFYGQPVSELETIVAEYLADPSATVADTLMATCRVYSLFQSLASDDAEAEAQPVAADTEESSGEDMPGESRVTTPSEHRGPKPPDASDLFNAWTSSDANGDPEDLNSGERSAGERQVPEQGLEEGEVAFSYNEWDRELMDHRIGWCRIIEKRVREGTRAFVEETRERHRGLISSIRHQFQLMKPEDLRKIANEIDGDDYDLNAVIDYLIDRRADGHQSERIYVKRLRRRRDVAVSFLLDQSSSTARTIGRHPLQPYTHPGRRIIEIEKEGLVLMSEALEAVGDAYSINGFTSEGRRNVKFYVIKDFDERYSEVVERRIGGITYQNNTRLGAAIRHSAARLAAEDRRTMLLIVLSDGRPYDHDYGDARYAREDTREALKQAKLEGITPFCITIDRESEAELRDLYGEIGYTIIDDVLSLPERLPGIYRRLTA